MRLAPFIVAESEAILVAWEDFARKMLPGAKLTNLALRTHAGDLLQATVRDMAIAVDRCTDVIAMLEAAPLDEVTLRINGASEKHAIGRLGGGFDLMQLVSEYRALRASVLSLWHKSNHAFHDCDVADLALFNASIDQSLATAVKSYTKRMAESRDMFLAILSHDLRGPLNAISMMSQSLPLVQELNPAAAEMAKKIEGSAKVIAKMISDLLDYTRTRLDAGMPIARIPMDLGKVAIEVVLEMRIANPSIDLHLATTGDVTGEWDPARIRQVFSNLIGNAIQHGDEAHRIDVTIEAGATSVWASIHNHGGIIPPDELSGIFDPLVRGAGGGMSAAPGRFKQAGSLGLGLYIARELVQAHGGRIEVTSTESEGTEFTFHLPRLVNALPEAA